MPIPVAGPSITDLEVAYVRDAVQNAWYENAGMYHDRFERLVAEYVGTRYAVSLPSCTSAIHLSLAALGIGPDDEVVVPDITWIASAAPVTYVGATPVFADIDPHTWCMNPDSLTDVITARTRAVIPVDLYGNMPDMDAIRQVADTHDLAVIEDAAEAIGSEYKGQRAGSFGRTGVFSFHASKTVSTGEGGMLVTDDEGIFHRVQCLRDHGRPVGDRFFRNSDVAFKYKMSGLQAALGLAQFERIEELVERKRQIFRWYSERLDLVPGLVLNHEAPMTKNTYWMVVAMFDPAIGLQKTEVMERLTARGIDSRPFFYPLSSLPAYASLGESSIARDRNKTAYELSPFGVNLPSGYNLDEGAVQTVCNAIVDIVSENARR